MTYDRLSTYLTWGGTIGSTSLDTWQCGVHLAQNPLLDAPGLPTTGELGTLLAGPLATFHEDPGTWISAGASLSWAKCAVIGTSGHYTGEAVNQTITAIPGGSTGTARGGPQLAACVTLWSGLTLGRANHGRFYVPWWEAQVDINGHVVDAQVLTMAANALVLVESINDWAGTVLAATARIRIMSKLGTGTTKLASKLRVGNVKDTQQRRRRQIPEVYTSASIAA